MPPAPRTIPQGAALLDRLRDVLCRFVILPTPETTDAVVLWIAATHAQPAWAHAPRLVISAPEKRCGKSRLLDMVGGMAHAPLITVNASSAAVYRSIGTDDPPTLLVDEADTIFGGKTSEANEELRGLLNAGHQRGRPAIRYNAATSCVEEIPTFAMAALAGIGAMPDTIQDRAVIVRMRRRAPGEEVSPYRHRRDSPVLREVADDLQAWLRGNMTDLENAVPDMPVEDRAADTWEPLVIVADSAGGDWPQRARAAAVVLTREHEQTGPTSMSTRLLTDCRTAFGEAPAMSTKELLTRLRDDPEAPWAEWGGPTGLTARRLSIVLAEYDITSSNVRLYDGTQCKGYTRTHFTDAWARYCPATATTDSPAHTGDPAGCPHHPDVACFDCWTRQRATA